MLRCLPAMLAVPAILAAGAAGAADTWVVDEDARALTWTVSFSGNPLPGRFNAFAADIVFDPDDLAGSQVTVTVEIASVEAANEDQTAELAKPEWFATETYPIATFTADTFRAVDGEAYEAEGTLTIRDSANPITLPFTFAIDGDTAHIIGGTTIDRTDYGVGQGDWAIDDVIGFEVEIAFDLTATRAP